MKQSLLAIIPLLVLATTANVYASGPRGDYDEAYQDVPGGPDCWYDGYDAGFSGQYDDDRAKECIDLGDQYNRPWDNACRDGGFSESECSDALNNPVDLGSHEQLQEENRRNCYDDGLEDGKNSNLFDKDRAKGCSEYSGSYRIGFLAGCQSVEGNTYYSCELTIEGEAIYCRDRPDDPACTEFLHNATNKKTPSPYGLCASGQQPYDPGCPQVVDPEKYCLNNDEPAFYKTVGDLCDADGFVKPEDVYCK